jgi:hypothetical protein
MAAGLGFKDFVTGEVLTAADVDGYLMQGVWVFASAAARDAAVTSPQEGNFAYLKDTNVTTYYTGSAWANLDTTGMTNPMTTTGDTIYSSSGSTPARLGIGTANQVLTVNAGATAPEWKTPSSGTASFVGTSLYKTADQSVSTSTWTALTWDAEYFDTDTFHSTSSNTSRITIPSGKGGKYSFTFSIATEANATGNRFTRFYKNGSLLKEMSNITPSSAYNNTHLGTYIVDLVATDYIELFVFQSSGGNRPYYSTTDWSNLSATYLGA